MLRCAGCGREVSEWAPACDACGRNAADAVGEPTPPAPVCAARPPRRPLLASGPDPADPLPDATWPVAGDEPPPPRRHRRAIAAAAAALALAGALTGLVTAGSGSDGRVLALTADGALVLTHADGSHPVAVAGVPDAGLLAAPDGRFLATGTGQQLVLRGRRLRATGARVGLDGPPGSWRAVAFADEDRALVATQSGPGGLLEGEVVSFAGRRLYLGRVAMATGDPRTLGAVTVAGDPQVVALTDAGRPRRTLVTSSRVDRLLGLPAGTDVAMTALPDRSGDRIAVVVIQPEVASGEVIASSIVVLDRAGRAVGVARHATFGLPAWSPDGRTLVYPLPPARRGGDSVGVWTVGAAPAVVRGSQRGQPLESCLWSTSGRSFLCSAGEIEEKVPWATGSPGSATVRPASGPPLPLLYER